MAKQANKPFLIILTVVMLFVVVGAFVAYKKPWRKIPTPDEFMARGEIAMTEKRYEDATREFMSAWTLASQRPDALTRAGDALYQLSKIDPENGPKAVGQWDQALAIDPVYAPALQSKMNAFIDEMEVMPRGEIYARVREIATQLTKVDPSNTRAAAYQYIPVLIGWISNVQTDPAKVDEAINGLKSISKSDPANPELPYYVAYALIHYGSEAKLARRTDEALARAGEAQAVMDKAAADQPGNAMMMLRTGQIYDLLDRFVPRDVSKGEYGKACGVYLDRARNLVKPEDEAAYKEISTVYASYKLTTGQKGEAETVYRELLKRRPNDVAIRLVLAEILQASRETRKEAADLLDATVRDGDKPNAPKTPIAQLLQFRALVRLASVRMDLLENTSDEQNRRELLNQIEADITKAEGRLAKNAESLKVRGRLLLIRNETVRALQALSEAAQLLDQQKAAPDYDLMYSLARANLAAQNNGEARRLLEQVIEHVPTFLPARMLLVDLLLNSNEREIAARHIDELEKQSPKSALVARFRIFSLDPVKDKAEVNRYYGMLPEESRTEKLEKARIAIVIDKLAEGARLLELVRAGSPGDVRVSDRLARLYIGMNQRDKATAVINDALKLNPKDPELRILQERMNQATSEDLFTLANGLIQDTADPLLRALQMADLERLRGNAPGMYKNLTDAEKIAPNDPRVQDSMFMYYLATKQWDAAYKYIDPLAKANYGGSYGLIYWWKFYSAKGDYAKAVQIGSQFTQKMPQFAISWITLAQAHKMRGEYSEALKAFNIAREKQSANRDAMRGSIDCLYALNRPGEAKKIIDDAVRLYPLDMGLQEMLVEHELKFGNPKNVMGVLLGNLEKEPGQIVHYLNASSMYYHISVMPGASPEASADAMRKGIEMLKSAVERFPDQPAAYVALADMQALAKQRDAGEATLKAMVDHPKLKDLAEPKLILAEYYLRGGEAPKAEALLRQAVAIAPKSQEIRRKLAVYLANNKRVDDALAVLEQSGQPAGDPMLNLAKAEILATAGRHADVETVATEALKVKPDDMSMLAVLANAQFNQNKIDAAIATSDRVLAIDPKNSRALIARGMAKMRRVNGDPADALPDLIGYRDQNDKDPKVRVLLAEVYNRKQRYAEAMIEMQAAVGMTPNDAQLRAALLEAYRSASPPRAAEGDQLVKDAQAIDSLMNNPEWLVAESTWMLSRKQLQRAVEDARKAMTLAPKEPRFAQHYVGMLLNTKNEAALLTETDRWLVENPERWWIYQARGLARKRLGDPTGDTEFIKAVNTAMDAKDVDAVEISLRTVAKELSPDRALQLILPRTADHPRFTLMAAQLYLQKGDEPNALKLIDQAMASRTTATGQTKAAILAYAGAVYNTVKPPQVDKAIAAYQELVQFQPDNVEALNQLAWMLATMVDGRSSEALQYSSKAYGVVANSGRFSATVFDTHAWVLVLCGKIKDGISILELVVDKAPTIEAHWHLSEAYRKDGKADSADAQLEKAQKLIQFHDANKIPVEPDIRSKIRDSASRAQAGNP